MTVRTDHAALLWLLNFKSPEGQLVRWLEVISGYDVEVQHRPVKKHSNGDALSRGQCKQSQKGAQLKSVCLRKSPRHTCWQEV